MRPIVDFHAGQTTNAVEGKAQMFGSRKVIKQPTTPYATQADFRRVFQEDMNRLYLLSFLLTGERDLAEQCFVGGLWMSSEGNPVFKEWATSWARRTIILNAIRMVRPGLGDPQRSSVFPKSAGPNVISRPEIANIIALPPFERFVFVMSVLECYTEQECSLLLGCTRREAMEARERALRRTREGAELRRKMISIASDETGMLGEQRPSIQFSTLSPSA
jgi:DNA-directed RNA polymerase specialized sigma24 family protein